MAVVRIRERYRPLGSRPESGLARFAVGPAFDRLLPASVLMGAGLLVLVDDVARSGAVMELPLGVLTALIGAPFFVLLLARARKQWL